jgi:uncharacterized protein affecting Mg2+/Co2+ transport
MDESVCFLYRMLTITDSNDALVVVTGAQVVAAQWRLTVEYHHIVTPHDAKHLRTQL